MKNHFVSLLATVTFLIPTTLPAQTTAFTYQGHLNSGGAPATGLYEITFGLYDAATNGNTIGGPITIAPISVSNGLFAATLDFGSGAFTGANRWLELSVTVFNTDQPVARLTPRQPITATPHALYAHSVASGSVTGLFAGPVTFSNTNNSFAGDGSELSGVSATTLNGIPSSGFWNTTGNAGTDSTTNFIGTVDAKPLKFGVNGVTAGRIYPNNLGLPSLIMGTGNYPDNSSAAGSRASVIGGGADNRLEFGESGYPWYAVIGGGNGNASGGSYNTIGGGQSNVVAFNGTHNTIPGGRENVISAYARNSTVGGGQLNTILGRSSASGTIAGGSANTIFPSPGNSFESIGATIGGGRANTNGGYNDATIAGGLKNQIGRGAGSTISGGSFNRILGYQMDLCTIAGGENNQAVALLPSETVIGITISGGANNRAEASIATIGGGEDNHAQSDASTIGGGLFNTAGGLFSTISGGDGNLTAGAGATIAGGEENRAEADYSTVSGGSKNSVTGSFSIFSTIGGGSENSLLGEQSFIGGGQGNSLEGFLSTISGGERNVIGGDRCTIAGGSFNRAENEFTTVSGGEANHSAGVYSVIAGGRLNTNSADFATVSGGQLNTGSAVFAAVGGGVRNESSGHASTVSGGNQNQASATSTTVGGGEGNIASGDVSTVGGGGGNEATGVYSTVSGGVANRAHGEASYIGGGNYNQSHGEHAIIGGGYGNISSNSHSTIPGGWMNIAGGSASFAAGTTAHALHNGAFVWADQTFVDFAAAPFPSETTNEFAVRATGGVRLVTAVDDTGTGASGVSLAPGSGTWSSLSDRNAKENFTPTDARAVLEKVAALPMTTWNYKTQGDSVRHIGPMAQDFHAAFGLGENDRTITTVDADGVALTAIQGLNTKLEEQLKAKDARISDLERRLAALEQLLQRKE